MHPEIRIMARSYSRLWTCRKCKKLEGGSELAFYRAEIPHTGASKLMLVSASPSAQPMNREFQARFTVIVIGLVTFAAVVFAGFNYKLEHQTATPDDGVWWLEKSGSVVADRLDPNGSAALAGVRNGDTLVS